MSVSLESPLTFCCENSIICTSSPWDELKPVRSAMARHPPSGVAGTLLALSPRRLEMRVVPENKTFTRCWRSICNLVAGSLYQDPVTRILVPRSLF